MSRYYEPLYHEFTRYTGRPPVKSANMTYAITILFVLALVFIINAFFRKLSGFIRGFRGLTQRCKRLFRGYSYLIAGPRIIDDAYSKAKGRSFRVATPSNDHVLVTSEALITEVINAPPHLLSLHAVATEMLQPKYTLGGFEWQEQRGVEGTGFVRALRSLLTSHLPYFRAELENVIRQALQQELSQVGKDGYAHAKLFPMIKRIVTKANCLVFFGDDLSKNEKFVAAALELPQVVILTGEVMRLTPGFLRRFMASLVTNRHSAARTLYSFLEPIVEKRLQSRWNRTVPNPVPVDCMQWLIDTSPRKIAWSSRRMVGEIMAIWFSSVHQLAITATYAVEDLCLHGTYVEPLRREIQAYLPTQEGSPIDLERLVQLDSFIKESIRCSNVDAISCRRKALQEMTLHDGAVVGKGDWVCIPQRAMMRDSSRYANPEDFDGRRFARANQEILGGQSTDLVPDTKTSSLTTTSTEWPIWGLGNTACPGRFYASLIMKTILVQILLEWECKMTAGYFPRRIIWRSSVVPSEGTVAMFRKRLS